MYAGILLIAIVSSSFSHTAYCQITEEAIEDAFSQLQDVEFKWTAHWLSTAYVKIWYVFS